MSRLFKKDNAPDTPRRDIRKRRSFYKRDRSFSSPAFKIFLAFNIAGASYAGYLYFNQKTVTPQAAYYTEQQNSTASATVITDDQRASTKNESIFIRTSTHGNDTTKNTEHKPVYKIEEKENQIDPGKHIKIEPVAGEATSVRYQPATEEISNRKEMLTYTVTGPDVYFHNQPDESTRRNAFINRWNKAVLKPLAEKNGFLYIIYSNPWGQTSKGWMKKDQLTVLK